MADESSDELRGRATEAVVRLQGMPAVVEDAVARARAEAAEGSDHDRLVHVRLTRGGADLHLSIDPCLLGDVASDLVARVESAYREAFAELAARSAVHAEQLSALARQLSQLQHP